MTQIVPRRRLIAASIAIAAIAAGLAHAQGKTSKVPPSVDFEADLGHASATAHAPFKAGGASWSCTTMHCTGKGPGNDPAATCAALVVQVGPLKTFTAAGKSADVKACNGVSPAMSAAPISKPMVMAPTTAVAVQTTKPAPAASSKNSAPAASSKGATPAAPPAAAPAPAPAKKGAAGAAAASGAGISFTSARMSLTGTGAPPTFGAFTPLAWTAAPMSITATGAALISRPPAGIAFTTDTMRLSGAP